MEFRTRKECTTEKIDDKKRVAFYLSKSLLTAVQTAATEEGTTVSEMVRTLLENYVATRNVEAV